MKRLMLVTLLSAALAYACGNADPSSGARGESKTKTQTQSAVASPLDEVRSSAILEQLKIGVEIEQNLKCGAIQDLEETLVDEGGYNVSKFSGRIICSTGSGTGEEGESGVVIHFSGVLGDAVRLHVLSSASRNVPLTHSPFFSDTSVLPSTSIVS